MEQDLQKKVREWREKQTDLVYCQALEGEIRLPTCEHRQRKWRHFQSARDEAERTLLIEDGKCETERTSGKFFRCDGCKHFRKRHVKKKAFKHGRVQAGAMPQNFEEDTYDAV